MITNNTTTNHLPAMAPLCVFSGGPVDPTAPSRSLTASAMSALTRLMSKSGPSLALDADVDAPPLGAPISPLSPVAPLVEPPTAPTGCVFDLSDIGWCSKYTSMVQQIHFYGIWPTSRSRHLSVSIWRTLHVSPPRGPLLRLRVRKKTLPYTRLGVLPCINPT